MTTTTSHPLVPTASGAAGRAPLGTDTPPQRGPWTSWWVLVLVAPTAALALGTAAWMGAEGYAELTRGYPGQVTALASTALRVVADVSTVLMAGALAHLTLLRARARGACLDVGGAFELRVLRAASAVAALTALAAAVVDAGDASGQSLARALDPAALPTLLTGSYLPVAWLVVFTAALVVHLLTYRASRFEDLLAPALLTAVCLLAPVVVTAVLVGPWHDVGTDAATVTTLAAAAALGSLAVAGLRVAVGRPLVRAALDRTGLLVVVAAPVAMAYQVVVLAFFSAGDPLGSGATGALGLVRLAALGAATVVGVRLRRLARAGASRSADPSVDLAGRAGLAPLLAAGTAAAAVFLGAGVAMTRVPPPQYFVPTSIQQVFLGYDVPRAPGAAVLLGDWRVNLLLASLAVVAVAAYALGFARLRRRGDAWPTMRLVTWVAGWAVVVLVTSTGLGKYSAASFSLHMLVHMCLTMLGPLLMVLAGPTTLALRATRPAGRDQAAGPHEWVVAVLRSRWLRVLSNPLLVFVVFVGSYYLLYLTPLFGEAMRFHWAHQVMNLHFIASGYLFYGLVVGVDQPPHPLPHLGRLGFVLAAMPFHAFFAVAVMSSSTVIARTYYEYLGRAWDTDLLRDQYVGGGIAWAAGEVPLLLVVLALAHQWSRQDAREAVRRDRRADRAQALRDAGGGGEDDVDAYNQMLARLAEADRRSAR